MLNTSLRLGFLGCEIGVKLNLTSHRAGSRIKCNNLSKSIAQMSDTYNQLSSVAQSCPTLCDPMNRSTPGLLVHHQLLESTQTHVHRVDKCSINVNCCYEHSSCGKSTQTFAKTSNWDAKVWAILLLLRRKRSKEVFVISLLSTVSVWLNLGDKWGSQPSGSEKKRSRELLSVCELGLPSYRQPLRGSPNLRSLPHDGDLAAPNQASGRMLWPQAGCRPCGEVGVTNNAVTGGQLFRNWWKMKIITSLLPFPHFC